MHHHKDPIHPNCFKKTKPEPVNGRAIKGCESSFQKSRLQACLTPFLAGCSTFTKDGGCSLPSGEEIIWFHRQLRITYKCHLDEQFPRGSKDTLKLRTTAAKPFNFNNIPANPQKSLDWMGPSVVWELFRHSFQVSRLFAIQLFYGCASYVTSSSQEGKARIPGFLKFSTGCSQPAGESEWTCLSLLPSPSNARVWDGETQRSRSWALVGDDVL